MTAWAAARPAAGAALARARLHAPSRQRLRWPMAHHATPGARYRNRGAAAAGANQRCRCARAGAACRRLSLDGCVSGTLLGKVLQQPRQTEVIARLVEEGLDPEGLRLAPIFGQPEVGEDDDLRTLRGFLAGERAQHAKA